MAHFAEIDQNKIVVRVVVVDNDQAADGENWCVDFFGGGVWVQTYYTGASRKNFAGIGFTYDSKRDAFIAPKPFPSWVLAEDTCQWSAPAPRPTGDGF